MPTLTRNLFYGRGHAPDLDGRLQAKHRREREMASGDDLGNEGSFELDVVEGEWPRDLNGYVFNVGPDRSEPGDHWFCGQGLLSRIDCAPSESGGVRVDFRRVDTPLARVRRALPHLFQRRGVMEISPFGFSNFANTNVQGLGDRLFIGYDVGRPIEVDPESLDTLTAVGGTGEWLQTVPAVMEPMIAVAAHPGTAYDEQALYFANYQIIPLSPERSIRVCRWDLEGAVEHWVLEGVDAFDSIHDIKVTRDYVVVMDLPFIVGGDVGAPGGRRAVQDFSRLWIVSKSDLRSAKSGSSVPYRELRIPMVAGHLTVDYEGSGSEITVYLAHQPMLDLGLGIEPGDRGRFSGREIPSDYEGLIPATTQPVCFGRYRIDAESGKILDRKLASERERLWGGLLFTQNLYNESSQNQIQNVWATTAGFDPELVSERWWSLYGEQSDGLLVPPRDLPLEPQPGELARIDLTSMELAESYRYSDGAIAHPPTFVPRVGASEDSDGYIVVTVHQDGDKELQIFDAQKLSAGPLARATAAGFNPPLLLHSWWAPRRAGGRPSEYRIDPERDAWEALQSFGEGAQMGVMLAKGLYGFEG